MKNNWQKVKLGDICNVNNRVYSISENWNFANYLDTGNITKNIINEFLFINLKTDKLPSRARRKVKNGNIIYSTVRPNQEHYGYIVSQPKNLLVSTAFAVLDINPECADSKFIYYLITQTEYTNLLQSVAEQSTTAYPSIKPSDITSLEIIIPPLDEQRKIAGILSALDDKMELNNKINRNLEAQAQAIFKSWFIDFEPFKNSKFIDSELGKIPEGWVCKKLKDFVEIKRGSSPRPIQDYLSGSGYNWLKISDATSESSPFIFNIKEHIKKSGISQTVYLVAGELVLSNSATPGIPKFLDVNTCIHDGWLWFSNSKLSYEFLYLFFLHKRRDFISLGNGSVFTNLKTDIVKDALFVYPNKAVMDEFDKITKTIFENIKIRSRESQRLTQLRDALLPKLMSGELTMSDYIV